jgi:hypothetical protein
MGKFQIESIPQEYYKIDQLLLGVDQSNIKIFSNHEIKVMKEKLRKV